MKTSSFLAALRAQPNLPVEFRAGSESLHPGYHLTEVKRVAYETMDCGAVTHRWAESQFELWVPPGAGLIPGRVAMTAAKFLKIVGRVETELPLAGDVEARIYASFGGRPAALHAVERVASVDGRLRVEVVADRARCKAAERRVGALTGGCCGIPAADAEPAAAGPACGCEAAPAEARSACCAG
jgi:hypothetical protein